MAQIFGDFRENLPTDHEFLILGFSPSSIPIQQRWRNNGLSADFVADYLATFFSASETDSQAQARQAEIKSAVSYIANELLENAMKFNDETVRYSIRFGMHLINDAEHTIVLVATNSISLETFTRFKAYVQEFLASDPDELYMRQLELTAESIEAGSAGLGLLTMRTDYEAKLGWKFDAVENEPTAIAVTTMVQLPV
ncbi:MAG: ATP-binding protein [Spirulinaceae cyanobacterium RM2_2_10]|nr:ATP-binding protein [Spirulinaceae cyanobacterium SM2_1_0]NJO20677.1 ATP-binding protein [Spirulinaceae cyanobacterium RM2_2_10]